MYPTTNNPNDAFSLIVLDDMFSGVDVETIKAKLLKQGCTPEQFAVYVKRATMKLEHLNVMKQ